MEILQGIIQGCILNFDIYSIIYRENFQLEIQIETTIFINYTGWSVVKSQTEMSALGFFTLSKSSMINAFSTVIGYLIVLIQFKPEG